tara:strand:- start:68 stop:1711 length:1644 start_codon:yes stop_codon:yes gene_type:complete
MGLVIILVIVLLTGLAIIGLANYKFVERTTLDVGASINGDRAMLIAQSAVEEAIHIVSKQINDPNTELFEDIRSQSKRGSISWDIKVPILETEILSQAKRPSYELVDGYVKAKVLIQRTFNTMLYEKYGTIEFTAKTKVNLGFAKSLQREFTEHVGFRMQLVSTPRPFDQATLYVHNIQGWIDPDKYNSLFTESKNRLEKRIQEWRQKFRDRVDREKSGIQAVGESPQELDRILITPALVREIPNFTPFPSDMIALSLSKSIDMSRLNVFRDLKQKTDEIQKKFEEVNQKDAELDEAIEKLENLPKELSSKSKAQRILREEVKPLGREFAQLTHELSKLDSERIKILSDFQVVVKSFGGQKKLNIGKFFSKFDRASDWKQKATYVIEEGGLQDNLKALFDKVEPVNGVVYVENPSSALKLSGTVKGKLLIVTEGAVDIENLQPSDPSKHIMSVISYGDMRVSGSIRASLMPQTNFKVRGSLRLNGNLVLRQITDLSQLKGRLDYDPTLHSGTTTKTSDAKAKKSYYYVVLSPMSVGSIVKRMSMGTQ